MKRVTYLSDNKGFTLIELIIVIAIIAIISLGTVLGVGILGYGNAKSATARIKSLSDYARIENMTKKEKYFLVIYHQDKDYFISIQTEKDGIRTNKKTEKLDLRKGSISFQNKDGNNYLISSIAIEGVNVRDKLELEFTKDTGGLKSNYLGEMVKFLEVECNNISYKIYFVEATGKAYVD